MTFFTPQPIIFIGCFYFIEKRAKKQEKFELVFL